MTSLRVKQIKSKLLQLFEAHLDTADLKTTDKERENKILTRCLAAFAIFNLSGCSAKEAALAVWDGSDDNGIDAAYFDASESSVLVVQSKWIHSGAGEPEAKDINTFSAGVRDLIEQNSASFAPRLQARFNEISQAVMTPGVTIKVVLISTGFSQIAQHGTAVLDKIVDELNGTDPDPIAESVIVGLSEIYPALATNASQDKISVDATILDWSHVPHPYSAYYGIIDGLQLKLWWLKFGKRLVAKNIRHALGATEVNNQIKSTAVSSPENFWYFNNGITLTADDAAKAPIAAASRASGNFQFKGASIVNGAQTVSTLGRVDDDESLGRVRVPIRVVVLKGAPSGFGGEVTRTNNLQNRIEARDFVAQDPEQVRLQMEMGIEGVEYQFLRSDGFVASPNACDLVEVTTALACASGDPAHAVAIKTGISRFFQDLTKAPYKAIFNPTLSGARAFNAVLIQREIDAWIDLKKKAAPKRSGFTWGALVHGNRVLSAAVFGLIGPAPLASPIADFRATIKRLDVTAKCEHVYARLVTFLDLNYPGKFLAVLFKSPSAGKSVYDDATK
jgi:hypothetical protein